MKLRIDNSTTDAGFLALIKSVEDAKADDTFDFTGSTLTANRARQIFLAIEKRATPAKLIFNDCKVDLSVALQLASSIKRSTKLQEFELKKHTLTEAAWISISEAMGESVALEKFAIDPIALPVTPAKLESAADTKSAAPKTAAAVAPAKNLKLNKLPEISSQYKVLTLNAEQLEKSKNPYIALKNNTLMSRDNKEPIAQLRDDYTRQMKIQHVNDKSPERYKDFGEYVKTIFPPEAFKLIEKHYSQGPILFGFAPLLKMLTTKMEDNVFRVMQPGDKDRTVDLFVDHKDDRVYIKFSVDRFPVLLPDEKSESNYFLRTPLELTFELEEKGFRVKELKTESEFIRDIYLGENFKEEAAEYAITRMVQFRPESKDHNLVKEEKLIAILRNLHEKAWMNRVYTVLATHAWSSPQDKDNLLERELHAFKEISDFIIEKWKLALIQIREEIQEYSNHPEPDLRKADLMIDLKIGLEDRRKKLNELKLAADEADKALPLCKDEIDTVRLSTLIRNDRAAVKSLLEDIDRREDILQHQGQALDFEETVALMSLDKIYLYDVAELAEQKCRLANLFNAEKEIPNTIYNPEKKRSDKKLSPDTQKIAAQLRLTLQDEWERREYYLMMHNIKLIPARRNELVQAEFKRFQALSHLARVLLSAEEKLFEVGKVRAFTDAIQKKLSTVSEHPLTEALASVTQNILNNYRKYSFNNNVGDICRDIKIFLENIDVKDAALKLPTIELQVKFRQYVEVMIEKIDKELTDAKGQLDEKTEKTFHPKSEFPAPPPIDPTTYREKLPNARLLSSLQIRDRFTHSLPQQPQIVITEHFFGEPPTADDEPKSASVSRASPVAAPSSTSGMKAKGSETPPSPHSHTRSTMWTTPPLPSSSGSATADHSPISSVNPSNNKESPSPSAVPGFTGKKTDSD